MRDYVRHNMTFLITVFPDQKKGSGYLRIIGIRFSNTDFISVSHIAA